MDIINFSGLPNFGSIKHHDGFPEIVLNEMPKTNEYSQMGIKMPCGNVILTMVARDKSIDFVTLNMLDAFEAEKAVDIEEESHDQFAEDSAEYQRYAYGM